MRQYFLRKTNAKYFYQKGAQLFVILLGSIFLTACAVQQTIPQWQMNADNALNNASQAYLKGESEIHTYEYKVAKTQIAHSGQMQRMAHAVLYVCAVRLATDLNWDACPEFEDYRQDATPAQLAYFEILSGKAQTLSEEHIRILPKQHQAWTQIVKRGKVTDTQKIRSVDDLQKVFLRSIVDAEKESDNLSALLLAALSIQYQAIDINIAQKAQEISSAQGYRRALLMWLHVQMRLAKIKDDTVLVQQLQRQIHLVYQTWSADERLQITP